MEHEAYKEDKEATKIVNDITARSLNRGRLVTKKDLFDKGVGEASSNLGRKKDLYFLGVLKDKDKDHKARTGFIVGSGKGWKETYRGYLKHLDNLKETYPELEVQVSNNEVKNLIRKQAKKENLVKAGIGATVATGVAISGYKAYKHYKNKKNKKKEDNRL